VLGLPPAFVLSQDQTLKFKGRALPERHSPEIHHKHIQTSGQPESQPEPFYAPATVKTSTQAETQANATTAAGASLPQINLSKNCPSRSAENLGR